MQEPSTNSGFSKFVREPILGEGAQFLPTYKYPLILLRDLIYSFYVRLGSLQHSFFISSIPSLLLSNSSSNNHAVLYRLRPHFLCQRSSFSVSWATFIHHGNEGCFRETAASLCTCYGTSHLRTILWSWEYSMHQLPDLLQPKCRRKLLLQWK